MPKRFICAYDLYVPLLDLSRPKDYLRPREEVSAIVSDSRDGFLRPFPSHASVSAYVRKGVFTRECNQTGRFNGDFVYSFNHLEWMLDVIR